MVFVGIDTVRTPAGTWPYSPYTKVQTTPVIQEKPYLTYDEEYGYGVIVPELRTDAVGVSWESGTKGKFVSLNKFYIANPNTDDADTINEALAAGKNLLFYHCSMAYHKSGESGRCIFFNVYGFVFRYDTDVCHCLR